MEYGLLSEATELDSKSSLSHLFIIFFTKKIHILCQFPKFYHMKTGKKIFLIEDIKNNFFVQYNKIYAKTLRLINLYLAFISLMRA